MVQAGDGVKKKAKKARTAKAGGGGTKKRGVKEEAPIVGMCSRACACMCVCGFFVMGVFGFDVGECYTDE